MFAGLAKYRVILVTGPHRSGTTVCAKAIAHDTGHEFVIEDEFNFSNLKLLATIIQSDFGPMVIQCPFLCGRIHDLKYLIDLDYDDVMVVMMHRYRRDIIESEARAKVNFRSMGRADKERFHAPGYRGHVSDLKYEVWERRCVAIPNAMDVGYESLRGHPLWVEEHKDLPFQHTVRQSQLPKVFRDGIKAAQTI